jgi:indole-3-glycerol phosphate synthase
VQAPVHWSPPKGVLGRLLASTAERVRSLAGQAGTLEDAAASAPGKAPFRQALQASPGVALIAEIKRRSPSLGGIAPSMSAADQALSYARGGAAAISVLTEPGQFGGDVADLDAAAAAGVPLLRKDFIIDRLQLLEARAHGASAVLLIVRALPPDRLARLHVEAEELGLDTLVEVHDDEELAVALAGGYPIVGVNNRNLETLEIDGGVCARLIPGIPAEVTAVYESGVKSRDDVVRAASAGADAVLVGTALSSSSDVEGAARALTGVPRGIRRAS